MEKRREEWNALLARLEAAGMEGNSLRVRQLIEEIRNALIAHSGEKENVFYLCAKGCPSA